MAANSCNYIIVYDGLSQIYGAATEAVALSTPLPKGVDIEDKKVFFLSYDVDNEKIMVYQLEKDKVTESYKEALEARHIAKMKKKALEEELDL